MGNETEWFRGVPWDPRALRSADVDGAAEATTEVARGFIAAVHADPSQALSRGEPPWFVTRGGATAVVSESLVVVGHQSPDTPESEPGRKRGGRGPRDYGELERWLADDGFYVDRPKRGHPRVLGHGGSALVTLTGSPSDRRSFNNDVAVCRRVLGLELRR